MISPQELRALRLFKDASANAVARLATAMRERVCVPGEVILREGEENAGLHLVASGMVAVRKRLDPTNTKIIAHLGKGEFFGEMSLLEKAPASAEVIAEGAVRLFILTRADFQFLMSKAPNEALDHLTTLLTGLSTRLRQTTRELVTVFQVARNVGAFESADALGKIVVGLLVNMFGATATIGFYQWLPGESRYSRGFSIGPFAAVLPPVIDHVAPASSAENTFSYPAGEKGHPLSAVMLPPGHLVISRSDLVAAPQALFVFFVESPQIFEPGDRQVMETVSSVLAPAFDAARARQGENRQKLAS